MVCEWCVSGGWGGTHAFIGVGIEVIECSLKRCLLGRCVVFIAWEVCCLLL